MGGIASAPGMVMSGDRLALFPAATGSGASLTGLPPVRRPGVGAETWIPQGVNAVVTGGVFPALGAAVNVGAPVAAPIFLNRVQARRLAIPAAANQELLQLSDSTLAIVLDNIRKTQVVQDPNGEDTGFLELDMDLWYPTLAANSQLQAAIAETAGGVITWQVMVTGWQGALPIFTAAPKTSPAGFGRYYPTNTTGLAIAGGNVGVLPAFGAWITVIDPAPNDFLAVQVSQQFLAGAVNGPGTLAQLGIGAAGAEVACGSFMSGHLSTEGNNVTPPLWVKAGERLAIRLGSNAAAARTMFVKVYDL